MLATRDLLKFVRDRAEIMGTLFFRLCLGFLRDP